MRLTVQSSPLSEVAADWLVVGLWEKDALPHGVADLDAKLGGLLTKLREQGDIAGKAKELTPLYQCAGIAARRLLLVGLGPRDKADFAALLSATAAAAKMISGKSCQRIAMALPDALNADATLRACAAGFYQGCSTAGIRKNASERTPPEEVCFIAPAIDSAIQASLQRAESEGRSANLARELVNTPPCDLYPESFAERAREIASKTGLEVQDPR